MPETETHKRRRSLQDTPADISKMRRLTSSLDAQREELLETEEEMTEVMRHVNELGIGSHFERNQESLTFSNASKVELRNLNVKVGRLIFDARKVAQLAEEGTRETLVEEELKDLRSRLQKIYRRVDMNVGTRMVLDAILMSLGEITPTLSPDRDLAIMPQIKPQDALSTKEGSQVLFGGSINYGVVEYEKDENGDNHGRLVGPESTGEFVFHVAAGHVFLLEAKASSGGLMPFIPEVVTQAMTISSNANLDTVRLCLSDGIRFIFFVLKQENGAFTYYESTVRELGRPQDFAFDKQLREIIHLLLEWLKPTQTDLYQLK